MNLAEVELLTGEAGTAHHVETIGEWETFPSSAIQEHGDRCCATAKAWFFAMDHSHMGGSDLLLGPRWIRGRYKWGPSRWPLYWCDAVDQQTLDCGALAALAVAAYRQRGVHCYTAQLMQRYTKHDTQNWLRNWGEVDAAVRWIRDDLVYHEACAVVPAASEIRIWDPTASWWVNPTQSEGYGAVLALRILSSDASHMSRVMWGEHRVVVNTWQHLQSARADPVK